MIKAIKQLLFIFKDEKKTNFFGIVLFTIFISLIETIGISIIMPFISVASDFKLIGQNKYFLLFKDVFGIQDEINFIYSFGFTLIIFFIIRGVLNLVYIYSVSKFTKGMYYKLATRIYKNHLERKYFEFIKQNSSDLTKIIIEEADRSVLILANIMYIINEFFIVVLIYSVLFYIDMKLLLMLSIFLGVSVLLLSKITSKLIKAEGIQRERSLKEFYRILKSTYGNFKFIKLKLNDEMLIKDFSNSSKKNIKANIVNDVVGSFPRIFFEAFSFGIVILIILYLIFLYQSDISSTFSVISIFVLGLYRMLPSLNRIMTHYNQLLFNSISLSIIKKDLNISSENLQEESLDYNKEIRVDNLFFEYILGKNILKNISISIKKGDRVAFIGESGSGKSTLIDLLMGVLNPSQGKILIDGHMLSPQNMKSWRKKIGYIPQTIYLFDGNVIQNVAFGEVIYKEKVIECLKKAQIYDFLMENHNGLETEIGENGILLSGGQKQRIAIARALYASPEILVLDEATSALDTNTEKEIMKAVYEVSYDKTLIIIAHRLSTIQDCNKIVTLNKGLIESVKC